MEWIQSFKVKKASTHLECDISDRLSCKVTVTLLCVMAAAVTMKLIVGDPIMCYCPNDFTASQVRYVESLCWVMNTYYIAGADADVPKDLHSRQEAEVSYYKWVPYILLLQAVFFYMPYFIWTLINSQSGIHVSKVVRMAVEVENWKHGEAEGISLVSTYLHCLFTFRKRRKGTTCCSGLKRHLALACLYCGKRYGNVLIVVYFFIKLLFIGNAIGQVFLIQSFLDASNYTFFGAEAVADMLNGEWHNKGLFPRLTLCDFEIRRYANLHRHTVQCVLPINLFTEKLYVFLWFWFCFVALVATFSMLIWFYKMVSRPQRIRFVKTYLQMSDTRRKGSRFKSDTVHFVEQHLGYDGVLLLRLIVTSAGDITAAKLIDALWKLWKNDRKCPETYDESDVPGNDLTTRVSRTTTPNSILSVTSTSSKRASQIQNSASQV